MAGLDEDVRMSAVNTAGRPYLTIQVVFAIVIKQLRRLYALFAKRTPSAVPLSSSLAAAQTTSQPIEAGPALDWQPGHRRPRRQPR